MFPISEKLAPTEKNHLNSYLPIRKKGNDFSWDTITGIVLSEALKRQILKYEFDSFRDDCKCAVIEKLDQPIFWEILERMYFSSDAIFNISPLFLLFKAQRKGTGKFELGTANQRMGDLFTSLMGGKFQLPDVTQRLNFIEDEFMTVLKERLEPLKASETIDEAYLPYLAKAFREDITFLSEHPKYLVQEFTNTLKLYAFAYCSQLALNIKSWRIGEPEPKPLYFILDTERASSERTWVRNYGYKFLLECAGDLFPLLSASEPLQHKGPRRPLWKIYHDAVTYKDQESLLASLNLYIKAFANTESRKLQVDTTAQTIDAAFAQLADLSLCQFADENSERAGVNRLYVRELERHICVNFMQSRGRAGRILVLNQDYLLLLTNLSIGKREKLRLHELVSEFQRRGFYLDTQSQQVLVGFYERMGNVERMSDSGDAVYVRKTV
ncbi:DNA phosphorothioation-dependent restriction protein DptG [Burkholderia sp. BCC1644]|uniref:DNA phosphorothioation-dependent restriction protein DptG n=1 Tax=Burkholderia sp. BCC1644 TaxID=2676293 RepID=UPI00159150A0|nr:DNA phosphorothioation-dependent restriction protein DptG [Burkholderia sp. BCC1644]